DFTRVQGAFILFPKRTLDCMQKCLFCFDPLSHFPQIITRL
ncbi:hypothetical protein JL09_g6987, partial [Pichia kudriavzevii]